MAACYSIEKHKIVKGQCPACSATRKSVVESVLRPLLRFQDDFSVPSTSPFTTVPPLILT